MPEREIDRRRERGGTQAPPAPITREPQHPVLALQRLVGNRAVAQVLARAPATTGSVHIPGVGDIKVKGGNLEEWTGSGAPETVDVTSHKGRHSGKLEKMASDHTAADVKVTIAPAHAAGNHLDMGGTTLGIKSARVTGYEVADGGVETWRLAGFTGLHRTKITHKVA